METGMKAVTEAEARTEVASCSDSRRAIPKTVTPRIHSIINHDSVFRFLSCVRLRASRGNPNRRKITMEALICARFEAFPTKSIGDAGGDVWKSVFVTTTPANHGCLYLTQHCEATISADDRLVPLRPKDEQVRSSTLLPLVTLQLWGNSDASDSQATSSRTGDRRRLRTLGYGSSSRRTVSC